MSDENNNSNEPNGSETPQNAELENLQKELQKAKNDHLYLMADFDNYKKRTIKERYDLTKYAGEKAFVEILNVYDNFERALSMELKPENLEAFKKGFELIANELKNTLERFGVKEVPSEGQPFDPMIHEALGAEESSTIKPGHITKVLKKPYKLQDKLIRPGQVVIAKEPSAPATESN